LLFGNKLSRRWRYGLALTLCRRPRRLFSQLSNFCCQPWMNVFFPPSADPFFFFFVFRARAPSFPSVIFVAPWVTSPQPCPLQLWIFFFFCSSNSRPYCDCVFFFFFFFFCFCGAPTQGLAWGFANARLFTYDARGVGVPPCLLFFRRCAPLFVFLFQYDLFPRFFPSP